MPRPWNPRLLLNPELCAKPQILQIAAATGMDRLCVIGRLVVIWLQAQIKATDDGRLEGKSVRWVNALAECAGFAEAMAAAGWLVIEPGGVIIPDFDTFISKRAIKRIEASDRQADRRSRTTDPDESVSHLCNAYVAPTSPVSVGTTDATPSPQAPPAEKKAKGGRRGPKPPLKGGPRFERFWAAYPRKEGRAAAMRRWDTLNLEGEGGEEVLVKILTALVWQARGEQWTKDGGGFIPHPGTYLNGRRWEDERERPGSTGPGRPVRSGSRVVAEPGEYGKKPKYGSSPPPPPDPPQPPPQTSLF